MTFACFSMMSRSVNFLTSILHDFNRDAARSAFETVTFGLQTRRFGFDIFFDVVFGDGFDSSERVYLKILPSSSTTMILSRKTLWTRSLGVYSALPVQTM